MAKIKALPAASIISDMGGSIDFYVHKGVVCVRRWPRPPSGPRSLPVQESAARFAYATITFGQAPELLKTMARYAAADAPVTWRDVLLVGYYDHLIDDPPRPFTPFEVWDGWP